MSTPTETQTRARAVAGSTSSPCVLLVVARRRGLLTFSSRAARRNRPRRRPTSSIAALEEAGARTPDADQIVRVLGDDGGAICDEPERRAEPGHAVLRS